MSRLPSLDGLDVTGRRVLVRADLNVPLRGGKVADDFRIQASLGTIRELRDSDARVIVCSHLGRPAGPDPGLVMDPVAGRLGELGGFPVHKVNGVVGASVEEEVSGLGAGTVAVLENTRFEPGEKSNDPDLAAGLARLADVFVLDAFGSAHRAHASTVGVAQLVPSAAGRLLQAEVEAMGRLLNDPRQPYIVALGGAKISDKLPVMRNLLGLVDLLIVGGGMCFTLLKAAGFEVGRSLVDEDLLEDVEDLLASDVGGKILLPSDIVVAEEFAEGSLGTVVPARAIPRNTMGLDIGPESTVRFSRVVAAASTVFWNGPMGVFEWESFRAGTEGLAAAVARGRGFTVVGGGDSAAALRMLGLADQVSHLSSGGGAGLEMLQGRELPGIEALRRWADA